jgi:aminoglycoside phosphotransferase (APT) family kinase protein
MEGNKGITIAFMARISDLPATLPTPQEITASKDYLRPPTGQFVVRVGQHYVVKYGPNVNFQEGYSMVFVSQRTAVPVPKLYAMFRDESTRNNFLVMEAIDGNSLGDLWNKFTPHRKTAITSQLHTFMKMLRGIKPPAYLGGVGQKPIKNQILTECINKYDYDSGEPPIYSMTGPWRNEEQLVDAISWKLAMKMSSRQGDFYIRQLPQVLSGHATVFTHGDLNRENIMVKEDGSLVLIDWEYSGFLPSFWEYCMCFFCHDFDDDWHEAVPKFLQEWPAEYA